MIMDLGSKLNGFDVILIFFLVLFMMKIQNHYSTRRRATEAVHYLDQVVSVSASFQMIGRHLLAFSSVIKGLVVSGYKY